MALGGMFANKRSPFAAPVPYGTPGIGDAIPGNAPVGGFDMSLPDDPYAASRPAGATGFNKPGGWADKLGGIGDILLATSGNPGAALLARQDRQRDPVADYIAKQEWDRAHPEAAKPAEEPSVIRTLRALGIDPTSADGRRIATDSLTRPFVVGSQETGWNVMGGSQGAPAGNIPSVSDQATYDAIPSGAQFRDPQGNIRTKP